MFENSLSLVDECGLAYLHVFPYSPRRERRPPRLPQVPGAAIKARAPVCAPRAKRRSPVI